MVVRVRWQRISEDERAEVFALLRSGVSQSGVSRRTGLSAGSVARLAQAIDAGGSADTARTCALDLDDRITVYQGLRRGLSFRQIAAMVERDPSTVSREVARNGGAQAYRPGRAQRRAADNARRPKRCKLVTNARLAQAVQQGLDRRWSPQQISRRFATDFGDDPAMQISHETIYQALYVQGRGELRRELGRALRSGRTARKPQGRVQRRGKIPDMVMISERPAEVEDRAVPGHWEGDLILGANQDSAIGTLVERTTRFVILLHLPNGRSAEAVRDAMTAAITQLPQMLRRSVTWDQGKEMAQHATFTVDTGIPVYFCDPNSPWQRGSNENTNGLLRQYFPKGTDLSVHSAQHLQAVADELNGRPRQTLGWMKPCEDLAELLGVAPTA